MVRTCGASSSNDTAIRTPRSGAKFRQGENMVVTFTAPVVVSHIWYSSDGEFSGGVAPGAVTGKTVMAESVRPWSGKTPQCADAVSVFRVKCAASMDTYPSTSLE